MQIAKSLRLKKPGVGYFVKPYEKQISIPSNVSLVFCLFCFENNISFFPSWVVYVGLLVVVCYVSVTLHDSLMLQ